MYDVFVFAMIGMLVVVITFWVMASISNEKDYHLGERIQMLEEQQAEIQVNVDILTAKVNDLDNKVMTIQEEMNELVHHAKKYEDNLEHGLYWLSQIVSAEAKGECEEGQIAVANVVLNRVKSPNFPNTIKGVIFQHKQFSPVANGSIYDKPYDSAVESSRKALQGKKIVSDDVLYFYNPSIVSRGNWIRTRKVVKTIGNHSFAK